MFEPGLGKVKGFSHKIREKPDAVPVQAALRAIPFAIREEVHKELDRWEKDDIVEKIDASEWVSPLVVVRKKTGNIRLCVDMRAPNKEIVVDKFPIPSIDELLGELRGAKYFARPDLANAYHQLELNEESRDLTCFLTHQVLYRFRRVPFGLASAPSAFQKMMKIALQGLEGLQSYFDDLVVYGRTWEEYRRNLKAVLRRLSELGIKLNPAKCEFDLTEMEFLGHMVTPEGIKPAPSNTRAILDAPPPKDATTLKSFLGLVGFYSKFCPGFASKVEPMCKLLRGDQTFEWSEDCQTSFKCIKEDIGNHITLTLFDPDLDIVVTTDASGYGLGAYMSQYKNGLERIVTCASRTLTDSERKYAVGEREALACVWACEKWHTYLWGRHFTLRTDHQTLTTLLSSKGNGHKPMRIARWNARLLQYNYTVEYEPGRDVCFADALSRLPLEDTTGFDIEDEAICLKFEDDTACVTLAEITTATNEDKTLQKAIRYTVNGWPDKLDAVDKAVYGLFRFRKELSVYKQNLLRGDRVVVPKALTARIIEIAHQCHQGIVRTKQRLRGLYWWNGMDIQVEQAIHTCTTCQMNDKTASTRPAPMQPVSLPNKPWEKLSMDIVGPNDCAPHSERFAITVHDYFSKWPEAALVPRVTTDVVISFLQGIFSREGYPQEIVTDHGPQFVSHVFEDFCVRRNIRHTTSAIYHPQANGAVERFNQTLGNTIQLATKERKSPTLAVRESLCVYRATPHATTGVSPSELLHGRRMVT
ncbi:uncharacterized protein K02A2.6-like [Lineus longissimus]|uniref:uncharacterized protein K02A2.6-like n=1 Tax=Lineus longissimus TaxID=88925 RepID=UPI00315D7A44